MISTCRTPSHPPLGYPYSWLQKKTGKENFPKVNLGLSICQLNVYLTIPIKQFFKMSLNFDHNSNVFVGKKVSHYERIVKMCQFYSDSSRFFLQPTVIASKQKVNFLDCRWFPRFISFAPLT
jgi:hypothetical protein